MTSVPLMTVNMSDEQQALYYAHLGALEKDEVAGVLLALFLGTFGLHHFYLRRNGLGVLYLVFFWTGIPSIAGFFECFFMPSRVQRYNVEQAATLAASIRGGAAQRVQIAPLHCASCGADIAPGVRFCGRCGASAVAGV